MDTRVTPPNRVISPTWGPPPPCKQALNEQNSITLSNVGELFWSRIPEKPYPSSEWERKFHSSLFTSFIKREIRHFLVVVLQWRQRNVQKSVMDVQSCCFDNPSLLFFWTSRCRRRHRILKLLKNERYCHVKVQKQRSSSEFPTLTKHLPSLPLGYCLLFRTDRPAHSHRDENFTVNQN